MSYLYNEDIINEVRDSNNIVDTISKYVKLNRIGSNYKGLCPFHNEKTPSFTVSEDKQMFHCFGCKEGGDVISFLMKHDNLEFTDALEVLADNANITLEKKNINPEKEKTRNILHEINTEAGRHFYRNLFNQRKAYDYLINRDVDKETIKMFGVGYSLDSWDDLLNYLKSKDYKEEDIEKAGLISKSKKTGGYFDRFRGRIMFPIMDNRGKIIGFGGRSIDSGNQPKYLNSPETPVFSKGNNLYALNIAKNHNRNKDIILVEGYMDVLSLFKYGIKNSVASLGTALTENQVDLLKRYSKRVYICYDSDAAGKTATNKAIDVMKKKSVRPKVIPLPENLDPDDFMKKEGVAQFKKLINNSLTSTDFKIQLKKESYDLNNHEDKINFLKDVSKLLKEIKSPVELEVYINRVSKETNISTQVIKQEINKDSIKPYKPNQTNNFVFNKQQPNKTGISRVQYMLKPAHLTAEKELLNLIINDDDIYNAVKDKFKAEDFLDPIYRKLALLVYDYYQQDGSLEREEILSHFEDEEYSKTEEIFNLNIKVNKDIKAIEDYIKNINYHKINLKKENIKKQINDLDTKISKTTEDIELFNKLCLELIEIDKKLKTN